MPISNLLHSTGAEPPEAPARSAVPARSATLVHSEAPAPSAVPARSEYSAHSAVPAHSEDQAHAASPASHNTPHTTAAMRKILIFLLILLCLNGLLSFLLEPYRSSSQEMWQGFHAMDKIDTIYTGTSQCLQGIDPSVIDSACGTHSYNMATNMQSLANSRAAIRAAIEEYGIQRAVLVVDHEILNVDRADNARADQSFWHGKAIAEKSFFLRLRDDLTFMTDPDFVGTPSSLTYLTPWVYNRTTNLRQNLLEKVSGQIQNTEGHRSASGYQHSENELDPSLEFITWEEADEWDEVAVSLQALSISEENLHELTAIRDLCAQNDVELIVIIIPYPNWLSIYRKDEILQVDQQLGALFSESGYDFYDFNLLLPEYYDAAGNEKYSDVGHMNSTGAAAFSAFFGTFLQERAAGADVLTWFRG